MFMAGVMLAAIIILGIFSPATAQPVTKEYPYFYKSPRAMAMGGAYVAVGGSTDTLFYNPAGLSTLPADNGWEVNIIGLTGEMGSNVWDMISDMQDAFDVGDVDMDGDDEDDQLRAVNDVLAKYTGDNMHLRISNFSSLGKRSGRTAYAFGGLASARLDGISHQGLGTNGLLDVNAEAHFGGLGGLSYEFVERLNVGASLKFIYKEALIHSFTAREIVDNEDNLDEYITDDLRESGNAFGVDIGAIYDIPKLASLKPAVGLSLLNIGDMDFGDAGKMPMTVNLGFSIRPEISYFTSVVIALDYIDMFNNFDQDSDIGKRIRLGGEIGLIDKKAIGVKLRTGLYEGYATFGADLRLTVITLSYVTYAEEVGAYAGQYNDRRHLAGINVGW
jgi:hypothetical protein